MKKLLYCLSLSLLTAAGCSKDDTSRAAPSRLDGPLLTMGQGQAHAWYSADAQGVPATLGFTLGKGAFDQLPATLPATAFMLTLPPEAAAQTPFQHIMINWNPQGHEPTPIYGMPHFDFHFYIMPMAEMMAIPPYPVNPAGFDNVPAAAFLPAGYVKSPGGVPGMGAHWNDPTSPEFNGQPFTQTFVFGSYNGRVTFWEPMVNLSYLKTGPMLDQPIKQPAQFERPGYYPTHFTIQTKADGSYEVALTQFVKH